MNNAEMRTETAKISAEQSGRSPMFMGMVLFLVSELFLFGSLFWTYYYLRAENAIWPPTGVHLDLTLAVINTVILLASSLSVWWAGRAIRGGSRAGLASGLVITMVLGIAFLGITIFEWTQEMFRPWTSSYGSIFYTLTGFHALHVFGGVVLLLSLLARTLRGRISSTNFKALEIGSLYWHYVDFIWLIVFSTLFIVK
jgi:heme/copper-type cytochrome/quinol oxidase subunit 3